MPVDVKARIATFIRSNGVTQQEVRRLRNEIANDAEGVTRGELATLASEFERQASDFKPTAALEVRRVLGLGIKREGGRGQYALSPYQGIDSTASRWASRWGAADQFDSRFPTYQKDLAPGARLPRGMLAATRRICLAQLNRWAATVGPFAAPTIGAKPDALSAIYDFNKNLVGYSASFENKTNQGQSWATCFLKLDENAADRFKLVGAYWGAEPQ